MPHFGPISRGDLIRALRQAGFEGPYQAGPHQVMVKADTTVRLPNPHRGDISRELLFRILRQANISREEWERI